MQVLPSTGNLMGLSASDQLFVPSTNMEYGQRYLENLRDMGATGGLLPKVMAAYNAGPMPVERWNSEVKDNGDPLLFRSEEHTSELQSLMRISYAVFCLKKKKNNQYTPLRIRLSHHVTSTPNKSHIHNTH